MKSRKLIGMLAVTATAAICSMSLVAAPESPSSSELQPGTVLKVNAITPNQQQVFAIKAVDPNGKLYPLKAIVHSGEISSVKVMGPNGKLLSVRAIASNGDIYPIKMLNKKVY